MGTQLLLGKYLPGNSFVHTINPCVKLISTIFLICYVTISDNLFYHIFPGVLTVTMIVLSGIPLSHMARALKAVWFLLTIVVVLFFISVLSGQDPVETMLNSCLALLKITISVALATLLISTTSPISIARSVELMLRYLGIKGISARNFSMTVAMSIRFVPILLEELDRIILAQRARGFDISSGNIMQRLRKAGSLIIPMLNSSFKKADDVAMAMDARFYGKSENPTSFYKYDFRWTDLLYITCTLSVFMANVIRRITH